MTVISGYVQLMAEADDSELRADYAKEVLKQFEHLTSMQREVLEFARGEKRIFIRKVLLKPFFDNVRTYVEHEIGELPVVLHFDVDNRQVARFDEQRVLRAIINLVRNAIEAMGDAGGNLYVEGKIESEELVVRVTDSGPGIPEEIMGRLFESFVTARKKAGTGLGLAIVKKTVDEHGGSVEVASTPQGATFALRLPQAGQGNGSKVMKLPMLGRKKEFETCAYCPKLCRGACPVSQAEPRESLTPWGKMTLAWRAQRDAEGSNAEIAKTAWACTGCLACANTCDHKNPVAQTLLDVRAYAQEQGWAPQTVQETLQKQTRRKLDLAERVEAINRALGAGLP